MNPNLRDVIFNAPPDTPIIIIQVIEPPDSIEHDAGLVPVARVAVGVSEVEVYLDDEMIAFLEARAENAEVLQYE
jgi:hypothetical protein